ncbi:MAG: cob(I)yrinic acid a,c-diamide adenosyltransferase [Verrucomicrobia bacterium]|nr:MAG: cob(I)yrinic acid a,c-diamide adenosyltransferase [Verrucomicrobiota bacterium]
MSIITGRGDSGQTDLLFGKRIAKSSARINALGDVDELNSALGLARTMESIPERIAAIDDIQAMLVALMGQIATLPEDQERYVKQKFSCLTMKEVETIVERSHQLEAAGVKFVDWARPGAEGSQARAALDVAKAVSRRAERSLWRLHESGQPVAEAHLLFLNRLADYLWILARA